MKIELDLQPYDVRQLLTRLDAVAALEESVKRCRVIGVDVSKVQVEIEAAKQGLHASLGRVIVPLLREAMKT